MPIWVKCSGLIAIQTLKCKRKDIENNKAKELSFALFIGKSLKYTVQYPRLIIPYSKKDIYNL